MVWSGYTKRVGVSYLDKRSWFIFGIKSGETDQKNKTGWLSNLMLGNITTQESRDMGIYSITDFPTYTLDIDFQNPEMSQNQLVKFTEEVENCCPVSESLGISNSDGEPQRLGEGLVWTPIDEDYCYDSGNFFKTKGQKHSVSQSRSN